MADEVSGKKDEGDKKVQDKMNALNLQVSKLKSQINEKNLKIADYEKSMQDLNKEKDAGQRDIKKQMQSHGNSEAKLNRALEEIEKYKLALREAKINETGKNENIRRDLDRLAEENKKLERQRNELL